MEDKWWYPSDNWPIDIPPAFCYSCRETGEPDCEEGDPICSFCGSDRVVDATGIADYLEIQRGER
jgi:hypothetical protein